MNLPFSHCHIFVRFRNNASINWNIQWVAYCSKHLRQQLQMLQKQFYCCDCLYGIKFWQGKTDFCLLDALQLSGMIYKNDVLCMQSWLRVPRPISTLADHSLGWLFYTPCPTDLQAPMGATLELQRLQHVERLEQQMMWAQLARQAPAPPAQVCTACCSVN